VRSVLDLARSLGLRTVAEGVETPAMKDEPQRLACDQYQGYLLSRPLPAAELDLWLAQSQELVGAGPAGRSPLPPQRSFAVARAATSTGSRVPLTGGA